MAVHKEIRQRGLSDKVHHHKIQDLTPAQVVDVSSATVKTVQQNLWIVLATEGIAKSDPCLNIETIQCQIRIVGPTLHTKHILCCLVVLVCVLFLFCCL